ncbi:hypothetical protein V1511DRAFT_513626 [Dipodascopsis uninucleata]
MAPFLVVIRDKPDTLEERLRNRPAHLERAAGFYKDGTYLYGVAVLKEPHDSSKGDLPAFAGSMMVVNGESKEAVMELLKTDPYKNVWDYENATIDPVLA